MARTRKTARKSCIAPPCRRAPRPCASAPPEEEPEEDPEEYPFQLPESPPHESPPPSPPPTPPPSDSEDNDEEDDPPPQHPRRVVHVTSGSHVFMVRILKRMLLRVGIRRPPFFRGKQYIRPGYPDIWMVTAHIRRWNPALRADRVVSVHPAIAPQSSFDAAVSEAARNALSAIGHQYRHRLVQSDFRHFPRRAEGGNYTRIAAAPLMQGRLAASVALNAALNTDLDSMAVELSSTTDRLLAAERKIQVMEAEAAGVEIAPDEVEEIRYYYMERVLPRPQYRYGDQDSGTHIVFDD